MQNNEFSHRREKLLNELDETSFAIVAAAPEYLRNGDSHYSYRQNSDFFYLTGLEEPEAVAIFVPGHEKGDFILFSRPKDKLKEQWDGYIAGQQDACEIFGADYAFSIADLKSELPKLMQGRQKVYYDFGNKHFDETVINAMMELRRRARSGIKFPTEFLSLGTIIHEHRLIKSEFELKLIRHAIDTTVAAHKTAMKTARPGLKEYHLAAEIHHEFQKNGCFHPAYDSIVGGGKNSCILHYIKNSDELKSGDLVLIDAGAEYQNYAADLTRTFPINGKYTEPQKLLYNVVLKSQKAALEKAKPGTPWIAMQEAIIPVLTEGLVELGILKGSVDSLIEEKAYLPFYMHNSGHWLGLDVHDVGAYKVDEKWRSLQPGMLLTIEPGLYISPNVPGVDEKWHGIGIRIEDDILITDNGHEILSEKLPKEVEDIESLMNSHS